MRTGAGDVGDARVIAVVGAVHFTSHFFQLVLPPLFPLLRDELGVLPPGDLRKALAALCGDDDWGQTWARVIQHRFQSKGDLHEHAVGNLLIVALWEQLGDHVQALDLVGSGGFATVGLPWCLDAVNAQAVQLLLADDDRELAGAVCPRCSWLGVTRPSACPVCGGSPRSTPDIVDEAAAAVIDAGGEVEHVYADTPLRQHVVASLTRFPVPRPD